PANILVDPAGDRVWLMGFGVASRIPRERQSPDPPELIAGTLSHMAPEQTGRMNRAVDSRSDLYSLGVTLYQAVTGTLPFMATDPLGWVPLPGRALASAAEHRRHGRPAAALGDHHEAARQDAGGAIPDCGGCRARSSPLPRRLGHPPRHRGVPACRARSP